MPARKKVLIITYYWPPGGGISVQRWLKFTRYLRGYDWEPVIYTVSNGDYLLIDTNLEKEIPEGIQVLRRPIWEPYQLYRLFGKRKMGGASSIKPEVGSGWMEKFSLWVRSNIFIPDARCFWIRPSIRFLTGHLKANKVDAIVSTGPPHSMHMIGMEVSRKTGIPWIADFRDPWTSMDYYSDLSLVQWADRKHHRLERAVLTSASAVIVVGKAMEREFEEKRGGPVAYIPNGYDAETFDQQNQPPLDTDFTIVHAGSLRVRRNPEALWHALSKLKTEAHPLLGKIKIKLIGQVEGSVLKSAEQFDIQHYIDVIPFIPHQELIHHLQSARILLLPIDNFDGSQWVLTGKLFEYMAAARPVLCIGPKEGDAAAVISETGIGETFDFSDATGIRNYLVRAFELYKRNEPGTEHLHIEQYAAMGLTKKLADILNKI